MTRLHETFENLRAVGRKAIIPFVTAGDPDLPTTAKLLTGLAACGCSVLELGIPYTDPIADGPVIQASYTRSLERGIRLEQIWSMLHDLTPQLSAPVVLMCSIAIVHRVGTERFIEHAIRAGVTGLIIPDLLFEEVPPVLHVTDAYQLPLIQLVTPTTPPQRAVAIARASRGFLYYVSVTGITGERHELPFALVENVSWLRRQTDLPICIGFGISSPDHVRLLAPVADGLIVGSAIVRRVAQSTLSTEQQDLCEVLAFVRSLLEAADAAVRGASATTQQS